MNNSLVSVIVPSYQSEANLKRFLHSFLTSTYVNYEIIINDDKRTTDNTPLVIEEAKNKGIHVILLKENISMAQGRKSGASHANGEFLLHLDSDMEITPNLLTECVETINKGYDALIIPEESFGTTFWAKCKWLEKKCYDGVEEMESLRFIKKNIYDKLGGHNELMIFSEDKDLDIRVKEAGYKVGRVKNHLRHNEGHLLLLRTLKKKLGYSGTANIFAEAHPKHFKWQTNIFNRYIIYFKNIKYLFSNPLLYIGMLYMKTLEYAFAAFGLISKK